MPADEAAARQWLEHFADTSDHRQAFDHLAAVINQQIIEELPQFVDPTLRSELHASTRAHWKGFLAVVTRDAIDVQPGPEIYDLARTLARRGYELPVLLSVYRIGQRAAWKFMSDTLTTDVVDADLRAAVLLQFWPRMSHWLDTIVESLIVVFTAEREQWQRGALARRTDTVKAILAGQAVDIDAATTALAYPLRQYHTAFTVWVDETVPDAEVQQLLDTGACAVGTAVGGARPLVISSGARAAWCWSATPKTSKPVSDKVIAALPQFVDVSVGTCQRGADGFRRSHAEAIAALTVAHRRGAGSARYADVELACLAAGIVGEDGMTALVERELGKLAAPDEAAERLRDTVRLYLEHAGDARAVGEVLNVHPNTVRYRVRQAEQIIGHPVDERRVYLEVALHAVKAFGIKAFDVSPG